MLKLKDSSSSFSYKPRPLTEHLRPTKFFLLPNKDKKPEFFKKKIRNSGQLIDWEKKEISIKESALGIIEKPEKDNDRQIYKNNLNYELTASESNPHRKIQESNKIKKKLKIESRTKDSQEINLQNLKDSPINRTHFLKGLKIKEKLKKSFDDLGNEIIKKKSNEICIKKEKETTMRNLDKKRPLNFLIRREKRVLFVEQQGVRRNEDESLIKVQDPKDVNN